ncbi:hypothetical protein VKT23_017360 [Stygiomarasmius scandens]|uniref:Derlin n=1 Tax=Marasmiellus scandens TaxID=2682957 RepID=A0ABR1ISD5_9AGAR
MDSIIAEIKKIPPVTRFMCISLVGLTLSTMLSLVSPYNYVYYSKLVMYRFQIWRLWSSFFLSGGGITFIFNLLFLYRNANELETSHYMRKSADLCWQLIFVALSIIVISFPLNPPPVTFLSPFLLSLIYLTSSLAPVGAQANLFGLITFPVKYYPYVILAMDFLLGGPRAAAEAIPGAIVGHIWWWGVWGSELGGSRWEGEGMRGASRGSGGILEEVARAPRWLSRWFNDTARVPGAGPGAGRGANQGGGVHVVPPRRFVNETQEQRGSGGYNWGSGRRLGGS